MMRVDDKAELWLSADDDPVNKAEVAGGLTSNFVESVSQTGLISGQLSFVAGQSYYFEVREMD